MIHGPFPTFKSMLYDAISRATYVAPAVDHALAEAGLQEPFDGDVFLDALAKQCGMVISLDSIADLTFSYELTEEE